MARFLWRATVITHRYLGVAVGLLMLVWFVSGIVMMYVGFPGLSAKERARALSPIPWQSCCALSTQRFDDDQPVRALELEGVAGDPVMRLRPEGQPSRLANLGPSGPSLDLDETKARAIAMEAARRIIGSPATPASQDTIDLDQWTVGGNYGPHRPLYRVMFGDPERTTLYVSSATGQVVLWTTATQRFWNWLGAVPHWLYPTVLRANGPLWSQTVIWTSILGGFLAVIGLYLGIMQFKGGSSGRISPYRGWFYWHHIAGLVFGILTLTWVLSGTLSMNPWGLLEGQGGNERVRLAGNSPPWSEVRASLAAIKANPPAGNVVHLETAPLAGKLFWLATGEDGSVQRLDAGGREAPVTPDNLREAAGLLAGDRAIAIQEMRATEDEYYFSHHDQVVLPVYRVTLNDAESTRYYLDPATAVLLRRVDATSRADRWLFGSLHRLDFPVLRIRPIWDIVVVLLMLGGTAVSATGVYLAFWRIKRDFTFKRASRGNSQVSSPSPS